MNKQLETLMNTLKDKTKEVENLKNTVNTHFILFCSNLIHTHKIISNYYKMHSTLVFYY